MPNFCWLAERLAEGQAAVLVALHDTAQSMAAEIARRSPSLQVRVVTDERGVRVAAAGAGLDGREYGSSRLAPEPVVGPVVVERIAPMVETVRAAVLAALGAQ